MKLLLNMSPYTLLIFLILICNYFPCLRADEFIPTLPGNKLVVDNDPTLQNISLFRNASVIFKYSFQWLPSKNMFLLHVSITDNKTEYPKENMEQDLSLESPFEFRKCCENGTNLIIDVDKAFCFSNATGTKVRQRLDGIGLFFHSTSEWLFNKWIKSIMATNLFPIEVIKEIIDGTCVEYAETRNIYILNNAFKEYTDQLKVLLKATIHRKIKNATRVTGTLCIVSSIFIFFAVLTYLILWKELNVSGLTQLSFLIALFLTYFVAGLRRLIGCTTLMEAHVAWFLGRQIISVVNDLPRYDNIVRFFEIPEALEDFCAVSTSANLVVLSFDLLQTLRRKYVPARQFDKRDGCKRFMITTTIAYLSGVVVMGVGLFIKWNYKYTYKIENTDLEHPVKYLRKLLEILLCIQNDMLLGICLPIVQLVLFLINLALYVAGVVILCKRQKETAAAYENILKEETAKRKIIQFWVRRFTKMFLLMGLWWPLSIICVFECVSIFNYTVKIWNEICDTYAIVHSYINYEIPWHMYIVSNFLVLQGIVICVLFVFNRRKLSALKRRYSSDPYIVNT